MNKTIFITGAAKRIGKEIALTFKELGWNIIIHFNSSTFSFLLCSSSTQRYEGFNSVQILVSRITCNFKKYND